MYRRLLFTCLICTFVKLLNAQIIVYPIGPIISSLMPEHGFLPGKKVKFYNTIEKYDFRNLKLRVELHDERERLNLKKVQCSDLELTNTSEFSKPDCIYFIEKYVDTIFRQSNLVPDSSAIDTVRVWLEGIDARLIGFGAIRAHGLCQVKIAYRDILKTYCVDITDEDKHSPISKNAFVTRLTATRIIASASVREILEQFLYDLKTLNR